MLKKIESKESEAKEMKESTKVVEHTTNVYNLKKNTNTPVKKPKLKERKDSVFKFGPETRKRLIMKSSCRVRQKR